MTIPRIPTYEPLDDTCAWCKHDIKVAVRSWETVKSRYAMPICANYCNDKTCGVDNCDHNCNEVALSTPENEERMLFEVVRRRRKLERLAAEAEAKVEAEAVMNRQDE